MTPTNRTSPRAAPPRTARVRRATARGWRWQGLRVVLYLLLVASPLGHLIHAFHGDSHWFELGAGLLVTATWLALAEGIVYAARQLFGPDGSSEKRCRSAPSIDPAVEAALRTFTEDMNDRSRREHEYYARLQVVPPAERGSVPIP